MSSNRTVCHRPDLRGFSALQGAASCVNGTSLVAVGNSETIVDICWQNIVIALGGVVGILIAISMVKQMANVVLSALMISSNVCAPMLVPSVSIVVASSYQELSTTSGRLF